MTVAYIKNSPLLIISKQKNGSINPVLLTINLPWLLLTWTIFKLQIICSRENFCDQIEGTNIWISRRPTQKDDISKFELIIDLTSEFLSDTTNNQYISYPNLDGHSLMNLPIITEFDKEKPTLIHCANGHGRSALFTAILLKENGTCLTVKESLDLIIKSRKLAIPNKTQLNWLIKNQD